MTNTIIDTDELPITLVLPPIKVGADYQFSIQILDDNDDPIVTTSWTMEIKGRADGPNGAELFDLTSSPSAGITMTAATGTFAVIIADTVTAALKVKKVYWDCKIVDASTIVTYPFEGVWDVKQTVTR